VKLLVDRFKEASGHEYQYERDYVNRPKPDGYRSHHMIFGFKGEGQEAAFDGRRVEIQVRTVLQHSWATSVEAVGLFRNEDMKGGAGDPDWLRLFQLISMEIALAEGCLPSETPSARQLRVEELSALEQKLDAVAMLETLSQAVHYTESYVRDVNNKPDYYLIKYNIDNRTVSVERYYTASSGVRSYDNAEAGDNRSGRYSSNAVLVEVDKIENLKAAYPNYFGDVGLFKSNLERITRGEVAEEYTLPAQEVVPPKPKDTRDYSWVTAYGARAKKV
jgi:hypothetical protein